MFAKNEGEFARILKGIGKTGTLPKGSDMKVLIYFVALLYGHNPQIRNHLTNCETTVIKQLQKLFSPDLKGMNLTGGNSVK